MRRFLVLAASVLALAACDVPVGETPPQPDALSGSLVPTAVATSLTVSARDLAGTQTDRTWTARTALVNGHLPANAFAQNKTDFAATVNASGLDASKKAELINGANSAFDQLESDLNAAFDGVAHRMALTLGDRVGDLSNASFRFTTKANTSFSADGLYNTATTAFALANIGFARGDGNANAAIIGLAGCAFQGALARTTATHGCSASGLLAVANAGAIGVGLNLTLDLAFTRD